MYCKTMQDARRAAQDNANYFKVPYCVFFDTNQNAHCEAYHTQENPLAVYQPMQFEAAPRDRQDTK